MIVPSNKNHSPKFKEGSVIKIMTNPNRVLYKLIYRIDTTSKPFPQYVTVKCSKSGRFGILRMRKIYAEYLDHLYDQKKVRNIRQLNEWKIK